MKDITEITEALQKGVEEVFDSDRYRDFLDAMSRFYDYSANNCMLIVHQCPQATLVASFKKWKDEFHRTVKKGEKAIRILAPVTHKRTLKTTDADGNAKEKEVTYYTFRAVPVFDYSQTEGEPLPTIVDRLTGAVDDFDTLRDRLIALSPVPVAFDAQMPGNAFGYYTHIEDRIVIRDGMSEMQTTKTMIHEIAHSILHRKGGEEEKADQNTREVQAESVAYTVCRWLGLDASDYSFGYIAGWSKDKEMKTLQASLETIRRTAKTIIDGLQEKQQAKAA